MRRVLTGVALAGLFLSAGCASAPPAPPAAPLTFGQKLAWILEMEDRRVLRLAAAVQTPATPGPDGRLEPDRPVAPDLAQLLGDASPRVRRRAALAVGRVGLVDGIEPLSRILATDPDPEVRQMGAFALGLVASTRAVPALATALADTSPIVRGRAAEALGLIGAREQAGAIAAMAHAYVEAGMLAAMSPDDITYPMSPEVEAVRLAIYALARLKSYDALASVVLDAAGQPISHWWPIAYALRRVEDPRAAGPLLALFQGTGVYTRGFAARGLGAVKSEIGHEQLIAAAADLAREPAVGVEAVRSLGELRIRQAAPTLARLALTPGLSPTLRAEALAALAATGAPEAVEGLLDLLSNRTPLVRAAAVKTVAALDADRFLVILSGLDPDPVWSVRAATAQALGGLPDERGVPLLVAMADDGDARVVAAVCTALAEAHSPETETLLVSRLQAEDVVVRAAAAAALAKRKAVDAVPAIRAAYDAAGRDASYTARGAILAALTDLDPAAARPLLETALADRDWAIRVRAAALISRIDPSRETAAAIRPAPTTVDRAAYALPSIVAPQYSTHMYFDTDKGAFEVELAVLDAPLTVHAIVGLARKGFFNGLAIHRVVGNFVLQDGDPRGDGEGGPGFTLRDEINEHPYLRGTVGMALDWRDTGGSQYFITLAPQPHLDGRYTVIGRVVNGMDVVDRLAVGDVVRSVRVWDGVQ
jgi:cyclophilin family peptidyl-prolyl cis-trans isomerase/HEAT repeat protein